MSYRNLKWCYNEIETKYMLHSRNFNRNSENWVLCNVRTNSHIETKEWKSVIPLFFPKNYFDFLIIYLVLYVRRKNKKRVDLQNEQHDYV